MSVGCFVSDVLEGSEYNSAAGLNDFLPNSIICNFVLSVCN